MHPCLTGSNPPPSSSSSAARPLRIETGKIAKQAAGAAVVRYGDTVVLVTVTTATPREGIDFFPLTVDYVEKYSAAGKIPGGFFKREARLSDREILVCRFIDRACRPLFADGYRDETQIIATVLAADGENSAGHPGLRRRLGGALDLRHPVPRPDRRGAPRPSSTASSS